MRPPAIVQPGLPLGDLPPQVASPAGRFTRCVCGHEVRPGQQCGWCGRRPRAPQKEDS